MSLSRLQHPLVLNALQGRIFPLPIGFIRKTVSSSVGSKKSEILITDLIYYQQILYTGTIDRYESFTSLRLGIEVHSRQGPQKHREDSKILDGQISVGGFFFRDFKLRQLLGQRVDLHPEMTNMGGGCLELLL